MFNFRVTDHCTFADLLYFYVNCLIFYHFSLCWLHFAFIFYKHIVVYLFPLGHGHQTAYPTPDQRHIDYRVLVVVRRT